MANDFKRMWTEEELNNKGGVVVRDYSQGMKDYNSKIIIKENTSIYADTSPKSFTYKCIFKDNFDFYEFTTKKAEFICDNELYDTIEFYSSNYGVRRIYYSNALNRIEVWSLGSGWLDYKYRVIMCDSSIRYGLSNLIETASSISYKTTQPLYKYLKTDTTELEQATPTDVSIIEDQGKIELMLEHDGNVLAVNDTPNQFLQRRLDKPSAEWDGTSNFNTWLSSQNVYAGQIVKMEDGFNTKYYVVTNVYDTGYIDITPLNVYYIDDVTPSGFVNSIQIHASTGNMSYYIVNFTGGGEHVDNTTSINTFELF